MPLCNTCFVLGAGFSAPAKLPTQAKILEGFSSKEMKDVRKIFDAGENTKTIRSVTLEDVFTFLDKLINNNEASLTANDNELFEVKAAYDMQKNLIESIIRQFDAKQKTAENIGCYRHFFDRIVRKKIAGQTNTIITLNWDTLPEFYINRAFKLCGILKGGVDYGCFDWDADGKEKYVSSIWRKNSGWKTIKVLKLHGSVNWIYSKRYGALSIREQNKSKPEVLLISDELEGEYVKETDYIFKTPTLLKDFANVHLQMIWNNACLDLCEAKRIVFLGYTLPIADFEFRYRLLKHVVRRKDVKIRVLIYDKENLYKKKEIKNNFKNLFVENDLDFKYMDIEKFLMNDCLVWDW